MTNPSVKNVSTADLEAAIAQALAGLTGWETCTVRIGTAKFSGERYVGGETVELTLEAVFAPKPVPEGDLPF